MIFVVNGKNKTLKLPRSVASKTVGVHQSQVLDETTNGSHGQTNRRMRQPTDPMVDFYRPKMVQDNHSTFAWREGRKEGGKAGWWIKVRKELGKEARGEKRKGRKERKKEARKEGG